MIPADPSPFPKELSLMDREPVAIINATAALFTLIVGGLAYAFGWSDEAVVIITGIVGGVSALAATIFARSKVTPTGG